MKDLPGATLLLKRRGLSDPGARERILKRFEREGIDASRLKLVDHTPSPREHLDVYNQVDICLDTFPYNGTTTTCEALWMGVPVVTFAGAHHLQRVSASILHTMDLDKFVTVDAEAYRAAVCALARDGDERRALRAGLRDRMAASSLCDSEGYVASFEKALRDVWRAWCDRLRPAAAASSGQAPS